MEKLKLIFGMVFVLAGAALIYYPLTAPCSVDSIGSVIEGKSVDGLAEVPDQNLDMDLPWQIERAVCISSNFQMLISMLLGAAFVTSGASSFVRKIVE